MGGGGSSEVLTLIPRGPSRRRPEQTKRRRMSGVLRPAMRSPSTRGRRASRPSCALAGGLGVGFRRGRSNWREDAWLRITLGRTAWQSSPVFLRAGQLHAGAAPPDLRRRGSRLAVGLRCWGASTRSGGLRSWPLADCGGGGQVGWRYGAGVRARGWPFEVRRGGQTIPLPQNIQPRRPALRTVKGRTRPTPRVTRS